MTMTMISTLDTTDDELLVSGSQTNNEYTCSSPQTAPVRAVGEHEYGWYLMDFDDDHWQKAVVRLIGTLTETGLLTGSR